MRSEKISILNEVIDRVQNSDYCFILNYGSVKVDKLAAMRRALEKQDSRMTVVKNTLLKKAAEKAEWEDISAMLSGPTAMITGTGDVAEVAKILVAFAKDNESSSVKGGNLEKAVLSAADIEELSKLPSKDAMRAMLLSTFTAPQTSFVRVLNAPLLDLLYALKAYEDKQGKDEPAA